MNDYQFGNFLRDLRQRRGLSQFQLGQLVGVSNKAVSKWETGAAKPQTGLCFKLAAALNVTVDELLACKFQEAEKAQKGNYAMTQNLYSKARTQMLKIYGNHPPAEVLGRFESEAASFEGTDIMIYLDFLRSLQETAREHQAIIDVRGEWGSSFIGWLMGATVCNPLPPHYYCPNCQAVEFHAEVRDGWDLPHKNCSCGHLMHREGHQITAEHFVKKARNGISLEIHIPESLFPFIEQPVRNCFDDSTRIYQLEMQDWSDISYRRYLLLPDTPNAPQSEDGTLTITSKELWAKYPHEPSILFVSNPFFELLHKLEQRTNWPPYQVDYLNGLVFDRLRDSTYPSWLNSTLDRIMEVGRQGSLNKFSDLLTASGLALSTNTWEGNGAELAKSGIASLEQLIAFREDVFHTILRYMPAGAGAGLPRKLMNEITRGKIGRQGLDDADEAVLMSLGLPQWYIDSIKKIHYLFPKAQCAQLIQQILIAIWYDIHYPDLCQELCSMIKPD